MAEAARKGDSHICPLSTPSPHVGGVINSGTTKVKTGGFPQARMTDETPCAVGPVNKIALGSLTVISDGLFSARKGDPTVHGGIVARGCSTVIIGEGSPNFGFSKNSDGTYSFGLKTTKSDKTVVVGDSITIRGDQEFQARTLSSMAVLSATPTGEATLKAIEKSGHDVTIIESTGGNVENADNFTAGCYSDPVNKIKGTGTNSTVEFNPYRKKLDGDPWDTRDPAVGLGHELIHSAHDANGTTDGRRNINYKDLNNSRLSHTAPGYELQAVGLGDYKNNDYTENKLRNDLGEEQRPHY